MIELKQNNVPKEAGWYFFCNHTHMRCAFEKCVVAIPVRVYQDFVTEEWMMSGATGPNNVSTVPRGYDARILWSDKLEIGFPEEFASLSKYQ